MVTLRPLTDANRQAVLSLRVSPAQEQFVSSVEESLVSACLSTVPPLHPASANAARVTITRFIPGALRSIGDDGHPRV